MRQTQKRQVSWLVTPSASFSPVRFMARTMDGKISAVANLAFGILSLTVARQPVIHTRFLIKFLYGNAFLRKCRWTTKNFRAAKVRF